MYSFTKLKKWLFCSLWCCINLSKTVSFPQISNQVSQEKLKEHQRSQQLEILFIISSLFKKIKVNEMVRMFTEQ